MLFSLLLSVFFCSCTGQQPAASNVAAPATKTPEPVPTLRLGYFNGGRNTLLYRALDTDSFTPFQVRLELWATPFPDAPYFVQLPQKIDEFQRLKKKRKKYKEKFSTLARTTGPEIVAAIKRQEVDCGAIGESTFLDEVVEEGLPWVAVVQLGHDLNETPGKLVVRRRGLQINSKAEYKGLTIASRQSGPFDRVMTREFLLAEGVDPADLTILDNVHPTDLHFGLKHQRYDLAFLHLHRAMVVVANGRYEYHRPFDWIEASVSQAVIVCPKEYVEKNQETLVRFFMGYKSRIEVEHAMTPEQRDQFAGQKTREMDMLYFKGLNIPQYERRPIVPLRTLQMMQKLLFKHKVIAKVDDISPYLYNDLIKEALKRYEKQPSSAH